jgi:GntR family transcriptional regulator
MHDLLKDLRARISEDQRDALLRSPLYHQIYLALKDAIKSGKLPRGARMPTELELSEALKVSRITSKRALNELAAEGLIQRFRAKGSFVTFEYRAPALTATLADLAESVGEIDKHSTVTVLGVERVAATDELRALFGLPQASAKLMKVIRVRSNSRGEPYSYYVSLLPIPGSGSAKRSPGRDASSALLNGERPKFTRVEQTLNAVSAPARVAAILGVPSGTALLSIRRKFFGPDGRLVELLDGLFNPKRYQYSMTVDIK